MPMRSLTARDALDDLQIKCIGLVTAEWSMAEAILSVAIWDYCKMDRDRGLMVTADLGSLAKINMVRALSQYHFKNDPVALAEIGPIMDDLATANSDRNTIVHSLWVPDMVTADSLRGMNPSIKSGKLNEKRITKNTRELMGMYERITSAKARLEYFLEDHGVTPPSRPKPETQTSQAQDSKRNPGQQANPQD